MAVAVPCAKAIAFFVEWALLLLAVATCVILLPLVVLPLAA